MNQLFGSTNKSGNSSIAALPYCRIDELNQAIEKLLPYLNAKYSLKMACFLAKVDLAWLKENCTDEQLALIAENHIIAKNNFEENTEEEPFIEAILIEETAVL
jgi:hypothetical protein